MRLKMREKRRILIACLVLAFTFLGLYLNPLSVHADAPYKTYTIDGYGYVTQTQTAYMPYETITRISDLSLSSPSDMMITKDEKIYIADTGNKRIVVSDMQGNLITTIGEGTLITPKGVYVTEDGTVYVADRDAKSIFVFDEKGNLQTTYTKPEHPLYGDGLDFLPLKIVVNQAGNMYIVCESNTNGVVQISPTDGGTFLGYFGANFASASVGDMIKRLVLTDAQRAKMVSNIPSTPDNLSIDEKGLIYTVTRGDQDDTLKKLNIAGKNLISPDAYEEIPAAVVAGNYENVFVASTLGYIYEYNDQGELLFVFGGSDDGRQRIGLCKTVTALGVDSKDRIYVLDSDMNQIQIFEPTEFTNLLHDALYLFSKGKYTESKEPLAQVLEMNSLFDYANMAMGRAYNQEENYEQALEYAILAKDFEGYSDAFWEIRNVWIRRNLVPILGFFLGFLILVKVIKEIQKRKRTFQKLVDFKTKITNLELVKQIKYGFYFIKHPIDGCYGIKREGRTSMLSSNVILFLFMVLYIINKYLCGFLVKTVREGRYEILSDIGGILIILISLTACNYLVCTINEGEGRKKQIYTSFVYSLFPYLVMMPYIFLLSHVITYNEVFLIEFAYTAMYVWIVILLVMSIQEINNYSFKETVKVIALTFFTLLILALLVFIIYILWSQVFDFILAIGGEVVYRLGL